MNTRNLDLPTWDEGNTEPDLVFNQLLLAMDALAKSPVESILSTPPGSPEEGQSWIVGPSPTAAWSGHEDDVAVAVTGGSGWLFFTPVDGWAFWVIDPGSTYRYLSGTWSSTGGGALTNPMTDVGDMIAGGVDGEPVRIAAGTAGQVPTTQDDGTIVFEDKLGSAVSALSIASGVVNIDCSLGDYFTLDLTADVTSITFSNLPPSGRARTLNVRFKQDATGSRTVALPSSFKAVTGSDTAVQSTSNAYTELFITSVDQGTRWAYSMKGEAA